MQQVEHDLLAVRRHGLLDEQFRPVGQADGAVALRREPGHDRDFQAGIAPVNDPEQLDAVHHRHADVQHREVNRLVRQNRERPIGAGGRMDFPALFRENGAQRRERLQKCQTVIHEQNVKFPARFGAGGGR